MGRWTTCVNWPGGRRGNIYSTTSVIYTLMHDGGGILILIWNSRKVNKILFRPGRRCCPLRWILWVFVEMMSRRAIWILLARWMYCLEGVIINRFGMVARVGVNIFYWGFRLPPPVPGVFWCIRTAKVIAPCCIGRLDLEKSKLTSIYWSALIALFF